MIKSRADKNRAIVEDPICCQQCVICRGFYNTGNGQLGGIRLINIISGFVQPGITLVLDAQLITGREDRFNRRTAIRLEALIIFIRSGIIIAISPPEQNRISGQQCIHAVFRDAGVFGNVFQFIIRQGANERIQRPIRGVMHEIRNARIKSVVLDPDLGEHLAAPDLVRSNTVDVGQVDRSRNIFHTGQCCKVFFQRKWHPGRSSVHLDGQTSIRRIQIIRQHDTPSDIKAADCDQQDRTADADLRCKRKLRQTELFGLAFLLLCCLWAGQNSRQECAQQHSNQK